jgi:hypothetical protein
VSIKDNDCDNASILINTANTYKNVSIKGNQLKNCYSDGIYLTGAVLVDGLEIEDNFVEYAVSVAGSGIITDLTNIGRVVSVKRNKFKKVGAGLNYNVRIKTTNKHIVDDNILDDAILDDSTQFTYPWRGNSTSAVNTIWKSCRVVGDLLVRGGSIPTAGTWAVGDVVYNSSAAASGKIGWVCITAGTFGGTAPVFKPFGAIDA